MIFLSLWMNLLFFFGPSSAHAEAVKFAPPTKLDQKDFYHLSEGSEIYPYDWLVRIKSSYEHERTLNWDRFFFDGIESRMNVMKDPSPDKYLLDYIGLSAAWSGHGEIPSDALKSDKGPQLRWVDSKPSVRMVGVSCAFCHSGSVTFGGQTKIIDGSQAMVNVQRLYADMIISTIALLFNTDHQLENFLVKFDYSEAEAKKLASAFAAETFKEMPFKTKVQLALKKFGLVKKLGPRVFEGQEKNISGRFESLLRLTHHLKPDQDLGIELEKKFQFLASYVGGSPEYTTQGGTVEEALFHKSNDGFGRLEAFVSAGNKTFRDRKNWVSVNGPVGFPPVWNTDKKAIFHYTGNTNATFLRNIGQAVSLGAVPLDSEYHSAVKIRNMGMLEKYTSQLPAPKWESYFTPDFVQGNEAKFVIKKALVEQGRTHYQRLCAECHDPQMVGPNGKLEYFPYSDLEKIGTDPNLAMNAVKPIKTGVLYSSLFVGTMQGIVATYLKDYPEEKPYVTEWSELGRRGGEWVRESYNPDEDQKQGLSDHFPIVPKKSGYPSRNLRGIWATAPYLHNNSVPTLWDLLQPASKRPEIFERGMTEFDPEKVGLAQRYSYTSDNKGILLKDESGKRLEKRDCDPVSNDFAGEVWQVDVCYDAKLPGNSNRGHEYGVDLKDSEKMELIEYLKTLN